MKSIKHHSLSGKLRRAFTLVEVLVVITIIAFLVAAVWAAREYMLAQSREKATVTNLSLIAAALEEYKSDNITLPLGEGDEYSGHLLYSMLSGDTNNDSEIDDDKSGQRRRRYIESIAYISTVDRDLPTGLPAVKLKLKGARAGNKPRYVFVDAWKKPFRYTTGCEAETTNDRPGSGINADFDVFSTGPDMDGDIARGNGVDADNISNVEK